MATIYLDHNVIVDIAGVPGARDAIQQRAHVAALQAHGHRFVLSAWNIYELANSNSQQHIDQCCSFVESLNPLWMSDSTKVKRQEVDKFLQQIFDNVGPVRNRSFTVFNETVAEMWGSFGEAGPSDETFTNSVAMLRARPDFLADVNDAATETPKAILTARDAYRHGMGKLFEGVIDREHLERFLPAGDRPQMLNFLMANLRKFLAASPSLAIEDAMSDLRVRDSFKPELGDAADLQHVMVPLGYCDYVVTNDGQLSQHCSTVVRKRNLSCRVCRRIDHIGY